MRLALVGFLAVAAAVAQDDDHRVPGPAMVEAGKSLFQQACSACHGQNGGGGHGPSLAEGQRVRSLNDAQLFQSIQKGVPGTDMPPSPLPEPEIRRIVAFVRSLGAPAIDVVVPGSPDAGGDVFFGKGGCSKCHSIAGHGGAIGPDLSEAGTSMTFAQLRESLLEPNKRIAEGFQGVSVVTSKGERIQGVAKNWDNYSIQLLDNQGKLYLLSRADLGKVEFNNRSLMPDDFGRRLSAKEIEDVLAFLSRQSVRPREKK